MNRLQSITPKQKYKHLPLEHYRYIQHELNHFTSSKGTGKTQFMKHCAAHLNTSLSNLCMIVRAGTVQTRSHDLKDRIEFSADAAFNNRGHPSNRQTKCESAGEFIDAVVSRFKDPQSMDSIDERCQSIRIHQPSRFETTVSTKTLYNYIHKGLID